MGNQSVYISEEVYRAKLTLDSRITWADLMRWSVQLCCWLKESGSTLTPVEAFQDEGRRMRVLTEKLQEANKRIAELEVEQLAEAETADELREEGQP